MDSLYNNSLAILRIFDEMESKVGRDQNYSQVEYS